jgi:hypothetical protein
MKQRYRCGRVESADPADLRCVQALRTMTPSKDRKLKKTARCEYIIPDFPPLTRVAAKEYICYVSCKEICPLLRFEIVAWQMCKEVLHMPLNPKLIFFFF